jgi:hypothetical protein
MKKILGIAVLVIGAVCVQAEESFLQLSLTPDVALKSRETTIKGISLNLWGENPQQGLSLGIVNGSTGQSSGFSWAIGLNYAESYTGVQWALVNVSKTSFVGWQAGVVNYAWGTFKGLQSGGVNIAQDATGVQLGWVNYTESLKGVQIGFVNIVMKNGWFDEFPNKLAKVFPFVNWSF